MTLRWLRPWPQPTPPRLPRSIPARTATCSSRAAPPGRCWPARPRGTPSTPSCTTPPPPSKSPTSSPAGIAARQACPPEMQNLTGKKFSRNPRQLESSLAGRRDQSRWRTRGRCGAGGRPGGHTGGMGSHVIAVVGATATGKSRLAIDLASALGGEIVNADSMQLYRGMDIGTAKEPQAKQQGVPHHLLDVWPVTRTANVAEYQALARAAIEDITGRGRVPVLVGGSGLAVRAALGDLHFPGTDTATRARLTDELARLGSAALHARLATLDPAAAAAILPGNGRRIVRALEVIEISGRPFTATMPAYESTGQVRPAVQIGLTLPRPELDLRIAAR